MNYLGLIDDEYEDDEMPVPEVRRSPALTAHDVMDEDAYLPTRPVQMVAPVELDRKSVVSSIAPRKMRSRTTGLSPHIHAVAPTEFGDARQIADSVMAGQPVIINLQTASRELKRRMIDFCSGVTCAVNGGMERIASNVFLITPSDVELSADERQRA